MELEKFGTCSRNCKSVYTSFLIKGIEKYMHNNNRTTLTLKPSLTNLTTLTSTYVCNAEKDRCRWKNILKEHHLNDDQSSILSKYSRDRNSYDFDTASEIAQNLHTNSDIAPQLAVTIKNDIDKPPLNTKMISMSNLHKFYHQCSKIYSTHILKKKFQPQKKIWLNKNRRGQDLCGQYVIFLS